MTLSDFDQVQHTLSLLERHGARVSEVCSIHIHVGGTNLEPDA